MFLGLHSIFSWNYFIQGKYTIFVINFVCCFYNTVCNFLNILKFKWSLSCILFACVICLPSWQELHLYISFMKLSLCTILDPTFCSFSFLASCKLFRNVYYFYYEINRSKMLRTFHLELDPPWEFTGLHVCTCYTTLIKMV